MLSSIVLPSPFPILSDFAFADTIRSRSPRSSFICSAQRSNSLIPKLEPFSRSRIDRWIPDPPFLQKTEDNLTGIFSYGCPNSHIDQSQVYESIVKVVKAEEEMKTLNSNEVMKPLLHKEQ